MKETIEITHYNQSMRRGVAVTDDGTTVVVSKGSFIYARLESQASQGVKFEAVIQNGRAYNISEDGWK